MKNLLLALAILFVLAPNASAQMEINGVTLYGNEWIDYDRSYWKITVSEDNMYKVTIPELRAAGLPVDDTPMSRLQLHHFGNEQGLYKSTNGIGTDSDFILFHGLKNRAELDRFVYTEPDQAFNPEFSLVTDEAAYFLSIADVGQNIQNIELLNTNLLGNTLQPTSYYIHKEAMHFDEYFYKPVLNSSQIQYSSVVGSEGFGTDLRQTTDVELAVSNLASVDEPIVCNMTIGGNLPGHRTKVYLEDQLKQTILSSSSTKPSTATNFITFDSQVSEVDGNNVSIRIESDLSADDKHRLGMIELQYPRTFEFEQGKELLTIPASSAPRFIEISGFAESENIFLTNMAGGNIHKAEYKNSKHGFILPASAENTEHFLYTESEIQSTSTVDRREFSDYGLMNHDYIIISNSALYDDGNGANYVEQYADYRSSTEGGSFNTVVVDAKDLYDQFGYGVDRHFISVRNFVHFVKQEWSTAKHVFIIGHSLEYSRYRKESQIEEFADLFQVPTFGRPGSDVLLFASNTSNTPILSFGRLAASSADDVAVYLDKVKAYEGAMHLPQTIADKEWQKSILHLSGGDTGIQDLLAGYLANMQDTIESNLFGGSVNTFFKKSSSTVQIALSDQIFDQINGGTRIITFFGHSSVGTFDFSLDKVDNYENEGKYPVLFSLGCHSGNIHTNDEVSISKNFILTPNKGAIAFIAATGTAYASQQFNFARGFYAKTGSTFLGRSIGEILISEIEEVDGTTSFNQNTFLQQLALHGDPAIKLMDYDAPDYVCDGNTAEINPTFVDTYQEDFTFCMDIVNLGLGDDIDLKVNLQHFNPNGGIETDSTILIEAPKSRSQICLTFPIKNRELLGENTIKVMLDPDNDIPESPSGEAESNNLLLTNGQEGFKFFVLSNSAAPVYPKEYAIIDSREVKLTASTFNAFDSPQAFHIEVDTTKQFNSSLKQSFTLENAQGTFSQPVTLLDASETVYYWRVSQDSIASSVGAVWNTSSFVYVPGVSEGWNHSHYEQFIDNEFSDLEYRDRELKYVNSLRDFRFINSIGEGVYFKRNETNFDGWEGRNITSGVTVTVIDTVKGALWPNPKDSGGLYGSINTSDPDPWTFYFEYPANTEQSKSDLSNLLQNVIPDNYSVVVQFVQLPTDTAGYPIEAWLAEKDIPNSLFDILENEGATQLQQFQELGAVPYVFAFVKGPDPKILSEEIAPTEEYVINLSFQVTILADKGSFTTVPIGPSAGYNSLEWDFIYSNIPENDSIYIDVLGITADNVEESLYTKLLAPTLDLSDVDHEIYPYLQIRVVTSDIKNRTTAIPLKLRVLFDQLPDIAIIPEQITAEEYQIGEPLALAVKILNPSDKDMSPFEVTYTIKDDSNQESKSTQSISALPAGEELDERFMIDTKSLKGGTYRLEVIANKAKNPSEEYYFNNLALVTFKTQEDKIAPVLSVTFDGVPILDNDIVSGNPLISIELKDENEYLLLEDTQAFTLLLGYPDGQVRQIEMDDPTVLFTPAAPGKENKAKLEFNPTLEQDGIYSLTVQATDASENLAGKASYEVRFRVFNEEMISNVFNYPNPFSTSTQFVFTLTGDEEPGNLIIRIMTVTGKVVREITMAELGSVHIGINKTDYKWDGTDEYGDKLGNGVYFYQVITKKMDGSDYIKFTDETKNNTDYLFKEGFGKMVIMR